MGLFKEHAHTNFPKIDPSLVGKMSALPVLLMSVQKHHSWRKS